MWLPAVGCVPPGSDQAELVFRQSSASIFLSVSLFLFEISFAAARTSLSYRNLARTRAAGSASSGGSTTQVMTYFRSTSDDGDLCLYERLKMLPLLRQVRECGCDARLKLCYGFSRHHPCESRVRKRRE